MAEIAGTSDQADFLFRQRTVFGVKPGLAVATAGRMCKWKMRSCLFLFRDLVQINFHSHGQVLKDF